MPDDPPSDADPFDDRAVTELVERVRSIIDGDESRILSLLEDRMDALEVDDLGTGVSEALTTSQRS